MAYIGRSLQAGSFRQLDDISSSFNGSTTAFTMQVNSTNVSVGDVNQILLSLGGVIQKPGTDFTVSGSTLTFTTAPAANTSFFAVLLGSDNGGTVTPTDGSVTTSKIVDDAVTTAKLADTSVTSAKLSGNLVTPGTLDVNGQELILDADADTSITADTDDQIDFRAGGTDTMHIINGKVGIGTATALSELHVQAAATPKITVRSVDGTSASVKLQRADADDVSTDFELKNDGGVFKIISDNSSINERPLVNFESSAVTFNEGGADVDFRIESSGNNKVFFVNGGLNEVTVGGTQNDYSAALTSFQEQTDHRSFNAEANTSSFASEVINIACTRNTNNDTYRFITAERRGYVQVFKVTDAGNVQNYNNSYGSTSDERIKTDITDSGSQWDDIKAIKVKKFKMGFGGDDSTKLGVIAQEVEAAGMNGLVEERDANEYEIKHNSVFGSLYEDGDDIPEGKKVGEIKENKEKVKEVKYSILYMKAIKALQEAQTRIETLEADVKTLKGE